MRNILIIILLVTLVSLSVSVNAESGSMQVTATGFYDHYQLKKDAVSNATFNFSGIWVDNSNFTSITAVQISGAFPFGFAKDADSTSFTIVSGATGTGGEVYYSKAGNYISWIFNQPAVITNNVIVVSYSNPNILSGVYGSEYRCEPCSLTDLKPFGIKNTGGSFISQYGANSSYLNYTANIGTTVRNDYLVTYQTFGSDVYFNASLDKSFDNVATKIFLNSSSSNYFTESSFNSVNGSFFGLYGSGLYIYMSTQVPGLYYSATINSSGAPVPIPVPTAAPIPIGSSASIIFGASSYQTGATGVILTNLSTSLLDIFSTYRVDFYSNTQPLISQFSLDTSLTTQSFPVLLSSPGTYTALLVKSTPILGDTILDQNSTQVTTGTSYIYINGTVPYHTQVTTNYSFGVAGINTLNYAIQTYYLNPDTNSYDFEHSFFGLSQNGTRSVYFEKIGTYILKLKNVPQNIVYAQTLTQTVFAAPQIEIVINTSSLNITKSSYFYGDTIFGNYTIDSTNWTSGQLYMSVYNYDKALTTAILQGTGIGWTDVSKKQQGELLVTLLNVPGTENFAETNFISGNNALRLMVRYNNGTDTILAYQNFTLTDQTATGYGLRLSKYEVFTNEKFFAYATVPEQASLILVNTGTNSTKGLLLAKINVNQSPATIPISLPSAGNYAILLNNPSGETEIMQNVVVIAASTPTPTPTQGASQTGSQISSLLQSPMFWGLIFIIGLMLTVAVYESRGAKK